MTKATKFKVKEGVEFNILTDDKGNVSVDITGSNVSVTLNDIEMVANKEKSKRKKGKSNIEIVHDFINEYKCSGNEIENKGEDSEKCYTVCIDGNEYFAFWEKENPQHICFQDFLVDYKLILKAKNENKYTLEDIKAHFSKEEDYQKAYETLRNNLKKYNVSIIKLIEDEYDVLNRYIVPIDNLKDIFDINALLRKYNNSFEEEFKII